jgi:16S rRNA (uracil1498-N3)-methyltransferase
VSLPRFHVRPEAVDGPRLTFDPEEARHMARVLRLRPGDVIVALDGTGREYTVRLETLTSEAAVGTVLVETSPAHESPFAVTLAQGVPKGDKMEAIVRAATELGVARIVPVLTERTIVRLDPARWRARARRWQRVAKEAAKQCRRAVVPSVGVPRPLADFVGGEAGDGLRLCLWEAEPTGLADVVGAPQGPVASATLLVGPEGGFSRTEVDMARAHGFRPVGLGPRILRTETAGPAVLAILQARFGDLGRAR